MPSKTLLTLLLIGTLFTVNVSTNQYRCRSPNGRDGNCVPFRMCPLNQRMTIEMRPGDLYYMNCEMGVGRSSFICCMEDTDFAPADVLPVEPNCGQATQEKKIMNGKNAGISNFPWLVLLEYNDELRPQACVGSLINHRYVVTAAHCVQKPQVPTMVRLGEYDTRFEIECESNVCNQPVVYVEIEHIFEHRGYDSVRQHNDIALILLKTHVEYTDFIKPVCLPLLNARIPIETNDMLTVSGWGKSGLGYENVIKQMLELPVIDQDTCKDKFSMHKINVTSSQICVGGIRGKDSCGGDSGGPLMRQSRNSFWYLEGITSYGLGGCGHGAPSIYTLVVDYIDWIKHAMQSRPR